MSIPSVPKRLAVGRLKLQYNGDHAVELVEGGIDAPLPEAVLQLVSPAPKPATAGDYLVVAVERGAGNVLRAHYERRLGPSRTPGIDLEIVSILYGISRHWPQEIQDQAHHQANKIARKADGQRRNLLKMPLVTIDDETAKDHDDAVYCQAQSGGGWRLWVAIADVSAYVTPDSVLDEVARARGTSIYLSQDVIPMLPEVLSNDMCSLKPNSKRLCLVCEMSFSATGEITNYSFYEGLMQSHARLSYNQVETVLSGATHLPKLVVPHCDALRTLGELYKQLKIRRSERGAIDIDANQATFIFTKQRQLKDIVRPPRTDAHKVIEECMISANVCAADFCTSHKRSSLYRVHEPPAPTDHLELMQFARLNKLNLDSHTEPTSKSYQRIAQKLSELDSSGVLALQILRAMSKAQYKTRNIGHFGLALPAYTHFTSPIRRYADLIVHRTIKAGIAMRRNKGFDFDYSETELDTMADEINQCTQRAEWAQRFAENWQKCVLMQQHPGQVFAARISGVLVFGVFIQLDAPAVDGLVHVSDLGRDYFEFDARRQQLIGTRTKERFRIGDVIQVRLAGVDELRRRLAFVPVRSKQNRRKSRRKR